MHTEGQPGGENDAYMKHGDATDVQYRVEVPANRHDLLCVEVCAYTSSLHVLGPVLRKLHIRAWFSFVMQGLSNALAVFIGSKSMPRPVLEEKSSVSQRHCIVQRQETIMVRPFVVAAILRNINLSGTRYEYLLVFSKLLLPQHLL